MDSIVFGSPTMLMAFLSRLNRENVPPIYQKFAQLIPVVRVPAKDSDIDETPAIENRVEIAV